MVVPRWPYRQGGLVPLTLSCNRKTEKRQAFFEVQTGHTHEALETRYGAMRAQPLRGGPAGPEILFETRQMPIRKRQGLLTGFAGV
jgi:hypothetical protein